MKLKLAEIPELPSEPHGFFLLPEQTVALPSGSSIAYRRAGAGPPVLLLHGLWTTAYSFHALIAPLASRCSLIMPELCPRGDSAGADPEVRPEQLADQALGFADALGLDRVHLVGHAESGLAGLHLALSRPERLHSLVVLGSSLRLPATARLRGWWLGRGEASGWARQGFNQPQQAALDMLDYADPTVISRQEIRVLANCWSSLPRATRTARVLAQTLSADFRSELVARLEARGAEGTPLPVPLKLVYGDTDSRAPLAQGEQLNRLFPGSELHVAERSSGATQVERSQWTAGIIATAAGV